MTTEEEGFAAVMTRFNTVWAGETAIAWPDDDFSPIADQEYVSVNWLPNFGTDDSLGKPGGRRYQYTGILMVRVFTPKSTHGQRNRFLCKKVLDGFRGQNLSGVVLYNGSVVDVGADGMFLQRNVSFEFRYDEFA